MGEGCGGLDMQCLCQSSQPEEERGWGWQSEIGLRQGDCPPAPLPAETRAGDGR